MLENLISNPGNGETVGGSFGIQELQELQKSLTAGYGTDVAQLSGGGALRIQSLDNTMQATVQDNKHFTLFNRLAKPKATATVDEWTEQHGIGGFLGGSTNTEDGDAADAEGDYIRQVGTVKYLSTYRKIPIVLGAQNNIVDAQAIEASNGSKQLLTDVEYLSFEGDDSVVSTEFNGIRRQLELLGSTDNIIDAGGAPLDDVEMISRAAEAIFGFGSFGTPTDLFSSLSVQTDLNKSLDPAFRVALDNSPASIVKGAHVRAIRTSYGDIATNQDVFIRDEKLKKVFALLSAKHAAIAAANLYTPSAVVPTVNASGGADSLWTATNAGTFYYHVTGVTASGQSVGVTTAQAAVAAGGNVSLAISASASGLETGYVIYRSRRNGSNDPADMREMIRIPRTGATTTYVDKAREVPGSTVAFVLNLNPSDHAISWKQFLPMMKIPMAAVRSPIIPWLQMICGYLRITKRAQHVMIKNIVPSGAIWKPF